MLQYITRGWDRIMARMRGPSLRESAGDVRPAERQDLSSRIRARYDTARKQDGERLTRQWLRDRGVLDDWHDAWRA